MRMGKYVRNELPVSVFVRPFHVIRVRKAECANETYEIIIIYTPYSMNSTNAHTYNAHSRRKPKNDWLHFEATAGVWCFCFFLFFSSFSPRSFRFVSASHDKRSNCLCHSGFAYTSLIAVCMGAPYASTECVLHTHVIVSCSCARDSMKWKQF